MMVTDIIGGGVIRIIKVGPKRREKKYRARIGLLWTDLGVITEGDKLGHIVVPRWPLLKNVLPHGVNRKDFSGWDPNWLIFIDAGSLNNALRMMWNTLLQQGISFEEGEKGLLSRALILARDLDTKILGVRKENIDKYKEIWLEEVRKIRKLLGAPRFNFPKLEALDQLESILKGIDSLSRVNQSALLARSITLQERIVERAEEEIIAIQGVFGARREALTQLIFWSECYLDRAYNFLERVFDEKVLEHADTLTRQRIARWLLFLSMDLIKIDFAPYVLNFRFIHDEFQSAQRLLLRTDFNSVMKNRVVDLLSRARQSLKIKYIQHDLEEIILTCTKLLYQKEILPNQWIEILQNLQGVHQRLSGISEAGFKIEVKTKALSQLDVAISLIETKKPSLFSQAREWMKNASSVL